MQNNTRILGVDPGYERLGIAVIEKNSAQKETLLFSDCIRTSPKKEHAVRLLEIQQALSECMSEYTPSVLAIETLFITKNQKTAIKVAEARGVILTQAASYSMDIHEFTPLQIKQAVTGYGKSQKHQVMSTLPHILRIDKDIYYDDEYDAIAVGITCSSVLNSPLFR